MNRSGLFRGGVPDEQSNGILLLFWNKLRIRIKKIFASDN
jgi:hypothetical protein